MKQPRHQDISVLIVEDSHTIALLLKTILSDFNVLGIAKTGAQALALAKRHEPDVITMDIQLPDTDGLALSRKLLKSRQIPIIIISALVSRKGQQIVFDALEAGAYEVLAKSKVFNEENSFADKLVRLVRSAALKYHPNKFHSLKKKAQAEPARAPSSFSSGRYDIVAIGASTGGPQTIKILLNQLPKNFPLPIVIAQHIADGFMEGFADWLDSQISLKVDIAQSDMLPCPHHVYFPPSACDLCISKQGSLEIAQKQSGPCPSVNRLFESVLAAYGKRAIFMLLTGMGSDGAQAMKKAHAANALTIAQDEASSVIYGMPGEAIRLGAVQHVLPLEKMAPWLIQLVQ